MAPVRLPPPSSSRAQDLVRASSPAVRLLPGGAPFRRRRLPPPASSSSRPVRPSARVRSSRRYMSSKDKNEFPFDGVDKVKDFTIRVEDSKLYAGTYIMSGYAVPIMIKKGNEIKKDTYDLIRNFQHNTLIPLLNFYVESNQGRFVIPTFEASFETWFRNNWRLLINETGSMSPLFDTMIVDICDLVKKLSLLEEPILIKNLNWKNLYMAEETAPRVVVLVTEAEALVKGVPKIAIWKPIQEIIEWCYNESKVQPSYEVRRYIGFIGSKNFTVKSLKGYAQNWDSYTKGEYIFSLIAASKRDIKSKMGQTGISWPNQDGNLPDLLDELVEYNLRQGRVYLKSSRFDYINLIRDTYKHFKKLPRYLKVKFSSEENFIKMLEQWSPTIWQDLYDEIGWP